MWFVAQLIFAHYFRDDRALAWIEQRYVLFFHASKDGALQEAMTYGRGTESKDETATWKGLAEYECFEGIRMIDPLIVVSDDVYIVSRERFTISPRVSLSAYLDDPDDVRLRFFPPEAFSSRTLHTPISSILEKQWSSIVLVFALYDPDSEVAREYEELVVVLQSPSEERLFGAADLIGAAVAQSKTADGLIRTYVSARDPLCFREAVSERSEVWHTWFELYAGAVVSDYIANQNAAIDFHIR